MTERFSASSAGKHMACHASANLELAIPGYEAPVRDENVGAKSKGRDLHAIVQELIESSTTMPSGKVVKFNATDMINFGRLLTYIGEVWKSRRFSTVLTEHTFTADWLPSKPKTTPDLVLATKDEIHILDSKMGKIPVEARDNEQLLFYAACAAHEGIAPKAKEVHLHIVQPWADNFDEWEASATTVKQFMDQAIAADQAITAGDTTFGPSDHCTFCPANPHSRGDKGTKMCPAMMNILYPRVIDEDEILNA